MNESKNEETNKPDEKVVENISELINTDPPPPELEKKESPQITPAPAADPVRPSATTADIIGEDELLSPPSQTPPIPPTASSNPSLPMPAPQANNGQEPIKRGRGRPVGSKTVNRAPDFSDVERINEVQVDYGLLAGSLFDMGTGTAATVFGPEWMPRDENERKMVVEALRVYLAAKQVKDIPPGLMLTVILVAYSAPRLNAPPTKAKLSMGWTWFKMRVSGFFRRKQLATAKAP